MNKMIIPAVLIGCLIVIWIGSVAANGMPELDALIPTLTAQAEDAVANGDVTAEAAPAAVEAKSVEADEVIAVSGCSLSHNYPETIRQWCTQIESAAAQHGLPANLIAAVMLQESGGDPLAYSSSGAVGLMQVMPRDGIAAGFQCINGPCFASRPTIAELQDAAFNINYGTKMLADLTSRHGSFREALFRYGPMNMEYRYADLVLSIFHGY